MLGDVLLNHWFSLNCPEHAYLALNRDNICAQKRAKYVLAEPKPDVKHNYVITVIYLIISNFNRI